MKKSIISMLTFIMIVSTACEKGLRFEVDGILVPKTVLEDSSLPSIEINGVQLHAETFGNSTDPILLVLHGGPGGDYRGLLNFKQLVEDDMYVVFYDQRGSGLSQRLNKDAYQNVQVFVDELDGVLKHYRNNSSQKVILAGHSWGAMLATAYINQNPNEITGVILAEPGGLTWEQTEAYIKRSRVLDLFGESTNDVVYQDQFITSSEHNTLDYKLALTLSGEPQTGDSKISPFWRFGAICSNSSTQLAIDKPEQMDFTANLMEFKPKVLFAYSELNKAYGLSHAQLVSSAYSDIEVIQINGCGHEIPQYGWSSFYPFIKNYLNEIL